MTKTITRADLSESIYNNIGLSRSESSDILEQMLMLVSDALVDGEEVKISSFGSFRVREKNERVGRNPKTGQEYPISARRVLSFRASNKFKDTVNESNKKKLSDGGE